MKVISEYLSQTNYYENQIIIELLLKIGEVFQLKDSF